ncbi:hypothetical protein RT717_24675 [Imperialibacter roseus]|uniref:Oligosaccharide repeat unit polymerase n=1 Tax=Imperialibacter roseus TaxID=1324217 RepID=A0ABZ0IMM4_9BACT|nr:hypothetical protein [Imperialibacter roseus]WOK06274.1 hypothetical protein RT717_24675 [Imperialibacter roseus]
MNLRINLRLIFLIPLGVIFYFVLGYWKYFYAIVIYGQGWSYFIDYISFRQVYLSRLDPIASYSLLYDFIGNGSIYGEYVFSYVTNTFIQFLNVFTNYFPNYLTLGQYSKLYYADNRVGLAFSFIIESILNFWFFGPIVAALFIYYIQRKVESYSNKHGAYLEILSVISIVVLVRTELAVFLKINVLPMVLVFFVMNKYFTSRSFVNVEAK